jgi:hypothetical protein
MRVDRIISGELRRATADGASVCHAGHRHAASLISRRRFLQATAGATAFGALGGPSALVADTAHAAAPGIGLALPIPATLDLLGADFHVQAPPLTGVDTDPATVNNFQGAAGIAFISGTVERTDRKTGETRLLPYLFNDMRFMQGVFRGRDGHERNATFAFI